MDVRWKQRFENFNKAFEQLKEFTEISELNKFEKQGFIQCFEYTFELAWKVLKDYLEYNGFDVETPRNAIQTAFQIDLIKDGHIWIDALQKRNLMAHTYDEDTADKAENLIRTDYFKVLNNLITDLSNKL